MYDTYLLTYTHSRQSFSFGDLTQLEVILEDLPVKQKPKYNSDGIADHSRSAGITKYCCLLTLIAINK